MKAIEVFAIFRPGRLPSKNLLPVNVSFFSCEAGRVSAS